MKRSLLISCCGVFIGLAGCTTEVTFSVPDMMCEDGCAVKVNEILAGQPGVRRVEVDFPNRTATVGVKASQFDAHAAVAALVDHGFENSRVDSGGGDRDAPGDAIRMSEHRASAAAGPGEVGTGE